MPAVHTADEAAESDERLAAEDNLTVSLLHQGKHADAEPLLRALHEVKMRAYGADHPSTLTTAGNLVDSLLHQGKYVEAELLLRALHKVQTCVYGADHPNTLMTAGNLVDSLLGQGKHADAERIQREVLGVVWCENHLEVSALSEADAEEFFEANAEKETVLLPVELMHAFLMGCNSSVPHLASGCPSGMRVLPTRLLRRIFELATASMPRPNSLDFERALPYPPEWDRGRPWRHGALGLAPHFIPHAQHWGTTWAAPTLVAKVHGRQIAYHFRTAPGPPLLWLRRVAALQPRVKLRLCYGRAEVLSGEAIYEDGSERSHHEGEYGEFYGEGLGFTPSG